MESWQGVFAVIFTPFKEDESIDEEALRKHINFLITEGKVHGIIPTGSTGEFASSSEEERKRVVDITVQEVHGSVPVVVGVAPKATCHCCATPTWAWPKCASTAAWMTPARACSVPPCRSWA